jgi:hypothetical protein
MFLYWHSSGVGGGMRFWAELGGVECQEHQHTHHNVFACVCLLEGGARGQHRGRGTGRGVGALMRLTEPAGKEMARFRVTKKISTPTIRDAALGRRHCC